MPPIVGTSLALLVLLSSGYFFVRRTGAAEALLLRLALAHLCGAAALGLGVTLGLVVTNQVSVWWGGLGLLGLTLAGFTRKQSASTAESDYSIRPGGFDRLEWLLAGMVAIGVVTALARVVLLPLDWDGWAIWQLKARAMADGSLQDLLTSPRYGYAHPDYPLLVPSNTWWLCAGVFRPKVAQLSGFLFFLDLLALVYYWGCALATRRLALLGCVVLVSWPLVMKHTASGFADVPMAAYALAVAVYLGHGQSFLGSLCLAGALLTKNEGLFTLLGATFIVLNGWVRGGNLNPSGAGSKVHPRGFSAVSVLAVGALVALSWAVMKRRWQLNADLLDPSQWPKDLASTLIHRTPGIIRGFVREAAAVGPRYPGWGLFWPISLLAIPVSARLGLRFAVPLLLMCVAHLIGITTAYLITPLDVSLHLSRSLDRLLLHLAPTLLLATLIALAAMGKRSSAPV